MVSGNCTRYFGVGDKCCICDDCLGAFMNSKQVFQFFRLRHWKQLALYKFARNTAKSGKLVRQWFWNGFVLELDFALKIHVQQTQRWNNTVSRCACITDAFYNFLKHMFMDLEGLAYQLPSGEDVADISLPLIWRAVLFLLGIIIYSYCTCK